MRMLQYHSRPGRSSGNTNWGDDMLTIDRQMLKMAAHGLMGDNGRSVTTECRAVELPYSTLCPASRPLQPPRRRAYVLSWFKLVEVTLAIGGHGIGLGQLRDRYLGEDKPKRAAFARFALHRDDAVHH